MKPSAVLLIAAACALAPVLIFAADTDSDTEDDEILGVLESALVRQGIRLLPSGGFEIEPETYYFYDEPDVAARRDHFGAAVTGRLGLPWALQAEVRVPYVIEDNLSGIDTSSGLGDIRLGLTKQLVSEQKGAPAVLTFLEWRTSTGEINRNPPTGFGQEALQAGFTVLKRRDPVVLFGSASYVVNLSDAELRNGTRFDAGNVLGAQLGFFLAATPDTSLFADLALNSSSADRFNGHRIESTNRLSGLFELGAATIISRGTYLSVTAGIGFTSAAPEFVLTVSTPKRL